eukprot:scaffold19055_cov48-Phaeocystis_antarctica.AAC.1
MSASHLLALGALLACYAPPTMAGLAAEMHICRITHLLSRRGALLAFLALPATAGPAAEMHAASHTYTLA